MSPAEAKTGSGSEPMFIGIFLTIVVAMTLKSGFRSPSPTARVPVYTFVPAIYRTHLQPEGRVSDVEAIREN